MRTEGSCGDHRLLGVCVDIVGDRGYIKDLESLVRQLEKD